MQSLPSSDVIEASYGGVPLGIEALLSIPAAHLMAAEFTFEPRPAGAHDVVDATAVGALR